jgi:hypothetical protein
MNHLNLEVAKHEMTRRLAAAERRSRQRATVPQRHRVRRAATHC